MSIYEELSRERKHLQAVGELPEWITTVSWQMLKDKYLDKGESLRHRFGVIADTAASYLDDVAPLYVEGMWSSIFFNLMWKGYLAPSTPVLANMGKSNGCSVSCSGQYIGDSVFDFYSNQLESALLSKNGFGTSGYLGDIRGRGVPISNMRGGASGIVPVFKDFVQVARDISQGSQRRGAWAGYLPIDHPDFYELINFISKEPDDANVGWCISQAFIDRLNNGDSEALERYQKAMKLKMVTGKGYFFKSDTVNELKPQWYKDRDFTIDASNLCTEIALPSNEEETFTCVLSSLNLSKWNEFKDSNVIFHSLVFLHCVALDFIKVGSGIKGLEKAVNFTRNHMALGLGYLGFHTYLQDNRIPFESLEANYFNTEVASTVDKETLRASQWLATIFGEAPVTKGYGVANATRIAIAPNLSSALICGGVSQGIEPIYKNVYTQGSAAGEIHRISPALIQVLEEHGEYNPSTINNIIDHNGSVQQLPFLTRHDKLVFKTAFEIDQHVIIRLAANRQRYIDQAQSINLFFSSDEDEAYISSVHKEAFLNPYIKSLYYIRSESGVMASKGECIACAS